MTHYRRILGVSRKCVSGLFLRLRDAGEDDRQHPVRLAVAGGFGGHRYGVDEGDDVAEGDIAPHDAVDLGTVR
ncbi:hypothetical protein H7I75_12350 [Mycobacterium stomatepiae]|nr:hypothetical protein [Mycobacterium stomatepiae]MCV7165064.1 hypothetical protein [Mycobacterium stomatepiae]